MTDSANALARPRLAWKNLLNWPWARSAARNARCRASLIASLLFLTSERGGTGLLLSPSFRKMLSTTNTAMPMRGQPTCISFTMPACRRMDFSLNRPSENHIFSIGNHCLVSLDCPLPPIIQSDISYSYVRCEKSFSRRSSERDISRWSPKDDTSFLPTRSESAEHHPHCLFLALARPSYALPVFGYFVENNQARIGSWQCPRSNPRSTDNQRHAAA